jgi:hypoxanthine phosphoribosyltransferase
MTARTRAGSRIRVLIAESAIAERVRELGAELCRDYAGRRPVLIAVLKGGSLFLADLIRTMDIDLEIDFIGLSSYGMEKTSSGKVRLVHDLRDDVHGRDVILVEGVVDTGHSLRFLIDLLQERQPRSIKVCALLDKVPCRKVPVPVDYAGFRIGEEFIIGYGMDAAETFRQLPYIGVVEPDSSGPGPGE